VVIAAVGAGRYSLDHYLAGLRPSWLIDAIVWPM
jgi:hypothetical protein